MNNSDDIKRRISIFGEESHRILKYVVLHRAINMQISKLSAKPYNRYPTFFENIQFMILSTSIISLGRIFDTTTGYTLNRLMNLISQNKCVLMHQGIKERMTAQLGEEGIIFFLEGKDDFEKHDFRLWESIQNDLEKRYSIIIKDYRNKNVAHLENPQIDKDPDYKGHGFTYDDFLDLCIDTWNLYKRMNVRYYNGSSAKDELIDKARLKGLIDDGNFSDEYIQKYLLHPILTEFGDLYSVLNDNPV